MRWYQKDHRDEIKAHKAALPPEEKKHHSAMSHLQTKKFQAKQKLENPKLKHVVPDKNKG